MAGRPLTPALSVWFATVLLHEPVQGVFRTLAERMGFEQLQRWEALLGAPLLLLATGGLGWSAWRRHGTLVPWLIWATVTGVGWLTLTQTRAEAIHLPQYALVAALLRHAGRPARAAVGAACILGTIDEAFQAFVLYARPMDWNDTTLNALGALAGVLAYWSVYDPPAAR